MNVWPIIVRELYAESRRYINYWLRVLGAGAMILVFALFMGNPGLKPAELGSRLFTSLNATVHLAIWVLAPLMTADCLSREKREGTLSLLFLTPLKPLSIVLGKSLIHGWRALTLLLAMIPLLAIPFLFGGVSVKDAAMATMLNTSALMLALAAGLLASVCVKDGVRVLFMAEFLSLFLAFGFLSAHFLIFYFLNAQAGALARGWFPFVNFSPGAAAWWQYRHQPLIAFLMEAFTLNTGWTPTDQFGMGRWGGIVLGWGANWTSSTPAFQHLWLACVGGLLVLATMALISIIGLAAYHLARSWRDQPASPQQERLFQFFCTPRFWRPLFRNKMTKLLEHNPVGWLQQYAWNARLTRWGWCLGLGLAECMMLADLNYLWSGQFWLAFLLLLALGFASAGSFRQEKETGALELLLVTPIKEWQIIGGRLRGIWSQFLPAALVLTLAWLYLAKDQRLFASFSFMGAYANQPSWNIADLTILCAINYLTLPVVGVYLSLKPLPFLACWLITCAWGIFLPWLVYAWCHTLNRSDSFGLTASLELISCCLACSLLYRNLLRRRFLPG